MKTVASLVFILLTLFASADCDGQFRFEMQPILKMKAPQLLESNIFVPDPPVVLNNSSPVQAYRLSSNPSRIAHSPRVSVAPVKMVSRESLNVATNNPRNYKQDTTTQSKTIEKTVMKSDEKGGGLGVLSWIVIAFLALVVIGGIGEWLDS